MHWVNGLAWIGKSYAAVTSTTAGIIEHTSVSALAELQCTAIATRRICTATDFSSWLAVTADEYQAAIAFPVKTHNHQDVYEFVVRDKTYQVPAIVLIKAMFRPLRGLAPYLFRPQSLENIMISEGFPKGETYFFCRPRTTLNISRGRGSAGILDALSWMYCFPSARHMWDSVLEHARQGRLGLTLPIGMAEITLRAFNHGDKWFITDMTIVNIKTTEKPFEFALQHESNIRFRHTARPAHNIRPHAKKEEDLPSRNGEWALSDDEWIVIERLIETKTPAKHDRRGIIDCILEKFGRGIAWNKLEMGSANRPAIVGAYQTMLKDGRWAKLLGVLRQLRPQEWGKTMRS